MSGKRVQIYIPADLVARWEQIPRYERSAVNATALREYFALREAARQIDETTRKDTTMDTKQLAQAARDLVANGEAKTIDEAIATVVRGALDRIAGTYTVQAENAWIADVRRVERATR